MLANKCCRWLPCSEHVNKQIKQQIKIKIPKNTNSIVPVVPLGKDSGGGDHYNHLRQQSMAARLQRRRRHQQ
jgi:hypothetical protein